MRKRLTAAAVALAAAAIPITAAAAVGTPQRSSDTPPGLEKNIARAVPGILKALVATQGSNSRLQDLPVSP
jgi:hypothetical protein